MSIYIYIFICIYISSLDVIYLTSNFTYLTLFTPSTLLPNNH